MASRVKRIYTLNGTSTGVQAYTGELVAAGFVFWEGGSGATRILFRDEVPTDVASPATDPILEMRASTNGFRRLWFNRQGGGLRFANGVHLTITGGDPTVDIFYV